MKYDVLIIGAGPAGSVAGSLLARAGKKVLALEAGTFPRFVIGESLLPRCNDLLDEAGLLKAVESRNYMKKPAALFWKGDQCERFCFAEMFPGQRPAAMQVPRADFDMTLATGARAQGVDIRFNQKVDAVEMAPDGSAVKAFITDTETNEKSTVEAKFLMDCSGYARVLPRLFNLEKKPELQPRVALFCHVENDQRPEGPAEGDIWICIHPKNAWVWIIPFSNGRTSVGVVAERQLFENAGKTDRERMWNLIKSDPNAMKRMGNAAQVMTTTKLEGWSAAVTKFHGPGWVLTGNASEFLDPVFSSGVTLALESSSQAAKLAIRQLNGEKIDWEKEYTGTMDKAVGVFRTFVHTWYTGELQRVLLASGKNERIKRAITSVLGGYVLDDQNPFVRDSRGMMESVLKLIG